MKFGKKMGIDL